ncbi:MAG TPA: SDR family NAD(P)-dependent oxidoreductase [bacterium]|nr:SDR family NAD(P)-dependent oxidoreductase [bacterium]
MPGIKDLRDKVVVVTGAGSGIGRASALAFAEQGSDLVVADVNEERVKDTALEIEKQGARAIYKKTDVSRRAEVEALRDFALAERGRVDVVHNNAGVSIGGNLEDTSIEDFEWIVSINFWGVIYGIKAFLPHMIERRSGHIVNTASVLGLCGAPGTSAYCATKFAVAGVSESLRAEVRKYNIGVTAICPGIIDTRIVSDGRMRIRKDARANADRVMEFYKTRGWPPERVARAVVKAVRHNRAVVPVGPEAWGQWFLKRSSQSLYNAALILSERFLM